MNRQPYSLTSLMCLFVAGACACSPASHGQQGGGSATPQQEQEEGTSQSANRVFAYYDLQFGATRSSLQEKAGKWDLKRGRFEILDGIEWSGPPQETYGRTDSFSVTFEDGRGFLTDESGRLLPIDSLSEDEAASELVSFQLELPTQKGEPDPIIAACTEKFGKPNRVSKPQETDLPGLSLGGHPGGMGFGFAMTQDEAYLWEDIAKDQRVGLIVRRFGESFLQGNLGTFRAALVFVHANRTRQAICRVLQDEQERRNQDSISEMAQGIRGSSSGNKADSQRRLTLAIESARKPAAPLVGDWIIRGREQGDDQNIRLGTMHLELGKEANQLQGTIRWIRGRTLGMLRVQGALCSSNATLHSDLLVLRAVDGECRAGTLSKGMFVAAFRQDQKKLVFGEFESPQQLEWWAFPAPQPTDGAEKAIAFDGKWRLQTWMKHSQDPDFTPRDEFLFALQEASLAYPYTLLNGAIIRTKGAHGQEDEKARLLIGYKDSRDRRLVLYSLDEQNEIRETMEGQANEAGDQIHELGYLRGRLELGDYSWRAIREEKIPSSQSRWNITVPREATEGGVDGAVFLEAFVDAYGIEVAISTSDTQYTIIGAREGDGRHVSARDKAAVPPRSATRFAVDNTGFGQNLARFLQRYGVPERDEAFLLLPEKLRTTFDQLELAYFVKENGKDPRKIQETHFRFDYERDEQKLRISVDSMDTTPFLSW